MRTILPHLWVYGIIVHALCLCNHSFAQQPQREDYAVISKAFVRQSQDFRKNLIWKKRKWEKITRTLIEHSQKLPAPLSEALKERLENLYESIHQIPESNENVDSISHTYYSGRLDSLRVLSAFALNSGITNDFLSLRISEISHTANYIELCNSIKEELISICNVLYHNDLKYNSNFFTRKIKDLAGIISSDINELQRTINLPGKREINALQTLSQNSDFRTFFFQNNALARKYNGEDGLAPSREAQLEGLQTKNSISNNLTQQWGEKGLTEDGLANLLLGKITPEAGNSPKTGGFTTAPSAPGYNINKINENEPFKQEISIGINIDFPAIMHTGTNVRELGISANYGLSPNWYVGGGIGYKFSISGTLKNPDWNHHGMAFRIFTERRINFSPRNISQLFAFAGVESTLWNSTITNTTQGPPIQETIGMIGITKSINTGKRITRLQILYPMQLFNNPYQISNNLIFRINYAFNNK